MNIPDSLMAQVFTGRDDFGNNLAGIKLNRDGRQFGAIYRVEAGEDISRAENSALLDVIHRSRRSSWRWI